MSMLHALNTGIDSRPTGPGRRPEQLRPAAQPVTATDMLKVQTLLYVRLREAGSSQAAEHVASERYRLLRDEWLQRAHTPRQLRLRDGSVVDFDLMDLSVDGRLAGLSRAEWWVVRMLALAEGRYVLGRFIFSELGWYRGRRQGLNIVYLARCKLARAGGDREVIWGDQRGYRLLLAEDE